MKSIYLTIGVFVVFLVACHEKQPDSLNQVSSEIKTPLDTIVGSKIITDEIAGLAHKKAIGYYVIIDKDSSDQTFIFQKSKDDGTVSIDLNIPYSKVPKSYKETLQELKIILPSAAKDFNLDSLSGIYFGRLILSGDLAIDITNQYHEKFGANGQLESYPVVGEFLKESKLGKDLDLLFNQYSISVDKVLPEKLFFTNSQELYLTSKIETDSVNIPSKILDCMTWIKLKRKLQNQSHIIIDSKINNK